MLLVSLQKLKKILYKRTSSDSTIHWRELVNKMQRPEILPIMFQSVVKYIMKSMFRLCNIIPGVHKVDQDTMNKIHYSKSDNLLLGQNNAQLHYFGGQWPSRSLHRGHDHRCGNGVWIRF